MKPTLHEHQKALLILLKRKRGDLSRLSLREIGTEIGVEDRAQIVAHHLDQLEKKGFLRRTEPGKRKFEVLTKPTQEVVYVDLYKTTAQCGPDGFLGDDVVVDRIPLSSKTFGITNPEDYFLIRSRGESMKPMIEEGDLVLARKQEDIDSGQIAVVVHDSMPKIKKVLKKTEDGQNHYVLVSLNNSFTDQEIADESSGFRICGQVRGVLKIS